MRAMLDSGATRTFISRTALNQTQYKRYTSAQDHYFMADGHTKFEVIGTAELSIRVNNLNTTIQACVVKSLCVECILGMDYINKYKINIETAQRTIQLHTTTNTTRVQIEDDVETKRFPLRLIKFTRLFPYQEKTIQIEAPISTGQILFQPSYHILHHKMLVSPHCLVSVDQYTTRIIVYNPTSSTCDLNAGTIMGTATSISSTMQISTIFDETTREQIDDNQTNSITSTSKDHIDTLLNNVQESGRRNELRQVLMRHHQLFDTTKSTIALTTIPHVICTGDNLPTTSRPYPQTLDKQNATFDIIQQMLKNKQIRASNSQYSAPVLLIKKRDGTYRFVIDYRKLNNITIKDNFPLPNIEQAIQQVSGHRFYTKLDLRSGYFQIPIREADKHKTAFITVHGLFEFNVLAQGLKNSPPSFQRIMSNLLAQCRKFCLVYLDDILIYSDSFEQHVQHVNQVLAILNKHKFQLNPEKCEIATQSIDYLGHTICVDGAKPLQERIEKILAIPQPTSLNQANAFIGAIGWYRKFIPNYAKVAAPILAVTNLTKKNRHKFEWNTVQKEAFDELKKIITQEPLFLHYPDNNALLVLATDASDHCVGGVLYQEIDGQRKNIYFHSQMLPKVQYKWPTIEKEALAIFHCAMRMKLYLLGREFIIQTDHCPLREMHKRPTNNRRVDRISLVLQQFNIKEVRHVAGKCHCMADYLSRYPTQTEDDDEFLDSDFGMVPGIKKKPTTDTMITTNEKQDVSTVGAVVTRAQAKGKRTEYNVDTTTDVLPSKRQRKPTTRMIDFDYDDGDTQDDQPLHGGGHEFDVLAIADAQKNDVVIQEKMKEITRDPRKQSYTIENGMLYKVAKRGIQSIKLIYVPSKMRHSLMTAYHDKPWSGHFGFRRTYYKLKDKYWWPDMKQNVRDYVQSCLKCQQYNVNRMKPTGYLHPIQPPNGPFQLIGIDYSGPFPATPQGNRYVLAITDYFTKWVTAIALPSQTAQATAEALYEQYICIYGVPQRILSDQGSHFQNQLMEAFTQLLGCHHIKSTPYHPQTNGAVERFNATFERQLAKLTDQQSNNWDEHLQSIVFAYNTGKHATTEYSPFQLQFGRDPKLPPDYPKTSVEFSKPNDYFHHFQKTLCLYHQYARVNMQKHQEVYKKHFDRNRKNSSFELGEHVLKATTTGRTKLSQLYSDPMIIIAKQHPTYWIQDSDNQQTFRVHVSQLRPFNFNRSVY